MKSLGVLIGGTGLFWALTAYPLRLVWGEETLLFGATAALLCLVPMIVTLLWVRWAPKDQPQQQLLAVLGGTGLRMFFVLGCGLALFLVVPAFQYQRFLFLIIAYYLFTLTLEVILLVRQSAVDQAPKRFD
jgi:hypothetical protein